MKHKVQHDPPRSGWRKLLYFGISVAIVLSGCGAKAHPANGGMRTPLPPQFLLFGANELGTLRLRASTTHQSIWLPIKQFVIDQLGTRPTASAPVSPIPPATDELDTYRNQGNQLIALAFVCVVDDDISTCNLTKQYLLLSD